MSPDGFGGNFYSFSEFGGGINTFFIEADLDDLGDLFVSCIGVLDNIYLFAQSLGETQCMLGELCGEFLKFDLPTIYNIQHKSKQGIIATIPLTNKRLVIFFEKLEFIQTEVSHRNKEIDL